MTTLPALDAYALLAGQYDAQPNALLSLERRWLAPRLPHLERLKMVDVAGGTGRWAAYGSARGARAVTADLSIEMLRRAPGIRIQADAARLPFQTASADFTICAFALGYARAAFPELIRITRPGGMVVVSDIHPGALARGWTRTFRLGDQTIEIASESYRLEDLRSPVLQPAFLLEPRLGPPEQEIFERAGRLDRFAEAAREPAIFIAGWIRM